MKVLLVRPCPDLRASRALETSFIHLEPLNLEIVAAGVPEEDEVQILDLSLYKKPDPIYEQRLLEWEPDMVGFTAFSPHIRQVKRLAKRTKALRPDTTIIVGGVHATMVPHDLDTGDIDVVVRGEGATAITEIIRRKKAGERLDFNGHALDPKADDFANYCAMPPPPHPRYTEVPDARRDLVDRTKYFAAWTGQHTGKVKALFPQVATVRTSVGCAYRCSFCNVHYMMQGKYVQRPPEDVVNEIASLEEEKIYFVDDEMFLNAPRLTKIAELLIERGIKKSYYSWARSDTICRSPELFKLWKKAGLGTVYVGLESQKDDELDEYNKGAESGTNRKAIEIVKEIGLTLHGCFIVKPDFSVQDFRDLEGEIAQLKPAEITFTVLSPSPGTQAWHDLRDQFIVDPYYFYDCMHTLVPTKLPLKLFYAHFSRLYGLALRSNPLRVNRVRVPIRDLVRAIWRGFGYILSLRAIYKDYDEREYRQRNQSADFEGQEPIRATPELALDHV